MQVILNKSALLSIILASVETFKKECLLILLGKWGKRGFIVEHAAHMENTRRKSTEVDPEQKAWNRINSVASCLFKNIKILGDCHSHTEPYDPERDPKYDPQKSKLCYDLRPSKADIEDAEAGNIYIIARITTKKRRERWRRTKRNTVLGTLDKYRFELKAFCAPKDCKLKSIPLSCPSAYRLKDGA